MVVGNAKELGALLREGRVRKALTQQQLADALGVSRQWVISAEAGSANTRVGLLIDALRYVDLMVDIVLDTDSQILLDAVFGGDHE
jgi:transcriptional regulator with XRE-family HTH domain